LRPAPESRSRGAPPSSITQLVRDQLGLSTSSLTHFCSTLVLVNSDEVDKFGFVALQRSVKRPKLTAADRFVWRWLSSVWDGWESGVFIVKTATVISWHRKGFGLFWTWKIRRGKPGRPSVPKEVRQLIRTLSRENPLWGAPHIHGELLKLGIDVGETSVSKFMLRRRKPRSPIWRTFLENHLRTIASVDFFVVPTIRFQILYVFLVLAHERPNRALRGHRSPHCGVDGTTDARNLSVGHRAALLVARSRSDLWP
jgi:hypothetical protein